MWNDFHVLKPSLRLFLIPQTSLLSFKIKYVGFDIRRAGNIHAPLNR